MTKQSPAILLAASVAGLLGGFLGSYFFSSTPAHAQRDWSMPEQPPSAATVPAQGFVFRTPDGRVAARLEADRGGTMLTLFGAGGAQARIGAGTRNATVHLKAGQRDYALLTTDARHAELVLLGGGRKTVEAEARSQGSEVRVDGRSLSASAKAFSSTGTPEVVTKPRLGPRQWNR